MTIPRFAIKFRFILYDRVNYDCGYQSDGDFDHSGTEILLTSGRNRN
jgi:hypothetical protein